MRALVLVGHGSRRARGNAEVHRLGERIQRRLGMPVFTGFIELSPPHAGQAIDAAVDSGATEVVVAPAVLLAAGHAKNDLPVLVAQARRRHPGVAIVACRPLGVHAGMLQALHELLAKARRQAPHVVDEQVGVLLLGRGSSDPDANSDVYKIGRLLTEGQRLLGHEVGFVGVTEPTMDAAFRALASRRPRLIVVVPYLLYPGVLVDRVQARAAELAALYRRLTVVVTEPVGSHGGVIDVLHERIEQAVAGATSPSCDVCKYRAPLPGFGHEVGGLQALRKAVAHAEIPACADIPPHTHTPPRKHVLVCVNRDCVDRGSLRTLDRLRRRVRSDGLSKQIQTTRVMCMGRCGEGPAVCVYPDGVWYRGIHADDADLIYEQHLLADRPVGHLIDQVLSGI